MNKLVELKEQPITIRGVELNYFAAAFILLCPVKSAHLGGWRSTIAFLQTNDLIGVSENDLYSLSEEGERVAEELHAQGYEPLETTLSELNLRIEPSNEPD